MPNITKAQIRFSDKEIEEIIEIAGYGIGYWAYAAQWDTDKKIYKVSWRDSDDEPFAYKFLSYNDIREAIDRITLHQVEVGDNTLEALISADMGAIDADAADSIIQIAALGEIVYG